MALQSSGKIGMNDIHKELSSASGVFCSMSDSDFRTLAQDTEGLISLSQFYGKSAVEFSWDVPTQDFGTQFFKVQTYTTGNGFSLCKTDIDIDWGLNGAVYDIEDSTFSVTSQTAGTGGADSADDIAIGYEGKADVTKMEARWKYQGLSIAMLPETNTGTKIRTSIHTTPTIIRQGGSGAGQGSVTGAGLDGATGWVDVTSIFQSGGILQAHVQTEVSASTSDRTQILWFMSGNNQSNYIGLELRATKSDGSTTNMLLRAKRQGSFAPRHRVIVNN